MHDMYLIQLGLLFKQKYFPFFMMKNKYLEPICFDNIILYKKQTNISIYIKYIYVSNF